MANKISHEDAKKIMQLCRLNFLKDQEKIMNHLEKILIAVERLKEVPLESNTKAMLSPLDEWYQNNQFKKDHDQSKLYRPDVKIPFENARKIIQQSPSTKSSQFKVPAFVENS